MTILEHIRHVARRGIRLLSGGVFERLDKSDAELRAILGKNSRLAIALLNTSPDSTAFNESLLDPITEQRVPVVPGLTTDDAAVRHIQREDYAASPQAKQIAALRGKYSGRRAFIIGNGPSINQQDLSPLSSEITFCTNWFVHHPQYREIRPTFHCVSSHEMFGGWGTAKPKLNDEFAELLATKAPSTTKVFSYKFVQSIRDRSPIDLASCLFLLFDRPKLLVDEKGDINFDVMGQMDDGYTGVISFCIPLALHMGITEIYLLGCDCDYGIVTPNSPKKYFYDFSKHKSSTTSFSGLQRVWADNGPGFQSYRIAERKARAMGVSIINCTAGGRLDVIPRRRLEDVLSTKVEN